MKFSTSAEVHGPATETIRVIGNEIESLLRSEFCLSSLARLDCEVRYTPIVMPRAMHERYPERSKVRQRQRIYDCSPQLDYTVFVEGSFEDQLREYVRGISLSAPHLAELGASEEQTDEFNKILASSVAKVLGGQHR